MPNLQIDASSPAIAVQSVGTTATVVTGSFTPPAGSVLAIRYSANTIDPVDPGNPGITDSLGAHLTYTSSDISKRPDAPTADGQVATWTAQVPTPSPGSMTITVTNGAGSGNRHAAVAVLVMTGADTVTPVGQHGKSSSTTNIASIAASFTATRAGSLGLLVVADWFDAGAESAGGSGNTLEGSADVSANYTYAFLRRTAADGVAGATTTVTSTLPGNSNNIRWAWLEILPAPDVASTSQSMPPWLMYRMALLRLQQATEILAQAQAEGGSAAAAVRVSGSATKVAIQSGTGAVAVRASGLGARVAAESGSAKVAVRTAGTAVNSRAVSGTCGVAVRGSGAAAKTVARAGTAEVAVRAAGLGVKVAPQAGTAAVAVAASGQESSGTARAQSGTCGVAVRGSGAGTKTVARSGSTAVAVRTAGAASKTVARGGTASIAVAASGQETSSTARAQGGTAAVIVRTAGAAGKTVARGGTASVAVRGSALGVKRAPEGGSTEIAVSATGLGAKRSALSGTARIAVSAAALRIPPVTHVRLGDRLNEILNSLISFTKRLAIFDSVQGHEPKSPPRNGLHAALWLQTMAPAVGQSSLDSTSIRIAWYLRIYQNFLSKPEDAIDPKVMRAMATVMEMLSGNFDLDLPGVRAIDLLGMSGPPMAAEAGYVPWQDGKIHRCMTLTIPIIVDDAFAQVA